MKTNYGKMVVDPLAWHRFSGDLSRFVAMGTHIDYSCYGRFMEVPIVGSLGFVKERVATRMWIIRKILESVSGLSQRHVARYLLRRAGLFAYMSQGLHS